MLIEMYDQESNLLQRRLEYLELMDQFLKAACTDPSLMDKIGELEEVLAEYDEVRNPSDVIDGLLKIYRADWTMQAIARLKG